MEPFKEPARPMSHWDFVLKEMRWMAVDFTEVSALYVGALDVAGMPHVAHSSVICLKPYANCWQHAGLGPSCHLVKVVRTAFAQSAICKVQ